ncbi:hypothetical protein [Kitasatospora sp. GP82]|uniref:hypothetical protein n=1 Tax=Kitasatospora sp. GP82 TaxID=3035089 RepID=UPI002473D66A|nr:hypothetical protein [Kitasatospora sp. GP82]MDH6123609.1 hypothetical protein [Kitasatospora sp. GP82]
MQRLKLSAGAAVLATVALAAACTSSKPAGAPAPWKLAGLPAVQADPAVQGAVEAAPSQGKVRIVGLVDVLSVGVLTVRQ